MVILNTSYENGKARIELNLEELALIALALKSQETGKPQSVLSNNFLMVSALVETGRISNIGDSSAIVNNSAIVKKTIPPSLETVVKDLSVDKKVKEISDPAVPIMCEPDPEPFFKKNKKETI
jgi:hypothetical protein